MKGTIGVCQPKSAGGRRCPIHQPGTRAMVALIRARHGFDKLQADAIFKKTYARAQSTRMTPSTDAWTKFLTDHIETVAIDPDMDEKVYARLAQKLHAAKEHVPDGRTYQTLRDLEERAVKADRAVQRQLNYNAAINSVTIENVQERYHAYRAQYVRDYMPLPVGERPTPPASWVQGFTSKDMMAVSAPADPATLYAMYRTQNDPDAYTNASSVRGFVSVDLETAGPEGRAGFEPENGSIIEVGIIQYDDAGVETRRYNTLIKPAPDVAAVCGTGPVQVHGITMDDVADAPTWDTVAPTVAKLLNGNALLAQNARFEQTWLQHHLGTQGLPFNRYGPTVDTMCIARQHYPDLSNHRLATICDLVGVAYTDGHRALHDADVTGRTFFKLRAATRATYREWLTQYPTMTQPPFQTARVQGTVRRVTRHSANTGFDPVAYAATDPFAVAPTPVTV